MGRENVRLSKPNFTTDGSFFYAIDETTQLLQCRTDDGSQAFGYLLDTAPASTIKELTWDGVFFWSLENHLTGITVNGFTIRKWAVDDFICKQIQKFDFVDDSLHTYRADAFAVEHYRTSVGLGNDPGTGTGYTGVNVLSQINLYDTSRMAVGDIVYFVKRWTPAHRRYGTTDIEQLYANSIISSTRVEFSTNTVGNPYGDGKGWRGKEANPTSSEPLPPDEVYWTKYLWVFNSYYGKVATPALYKINAYTGANIAQYSGTQYGSVGGSTFYVKYNTDVKTDPDHTYDSNTFNTSVVDDVSRGGKQTYVLFIKGATCMFYNSLTGVMDRSMAIDNIKTDSVNIWPVYDMDIIGTEPDVSILRLQTGTTYKNSGGTWVDESWATYNYDRSILKRHARSVSVTATPSIVPISTGTASIVAYIRDQYNEAIPNGKIVSFTDDDSGTSSAYVSPTSVGTDAFGRAWTSFFAGGTEKDVKITATCTWVDDT